MDIDDEDDFYAPEEPQAPATATPAEASTVKKEPNDELESGEEEDEGGAMDEDEDSDIDIVTERKDSQPAPPPQSRYSEIKNIPQRTAGSDTTTPAPKPSRQHQPPQQHQNIQHPPASTSKIDIHAIPLHKPTNKPLTQVNIDTDLPPSGDQDRPWRRPGTDLSDYFNYGFDEFTWALYAQKQEALRAEYNPEAIAQSNKKMMEEMTSMMMMGGMPGMPGAGAGGGPGAAGAGQGPGGVGVGAGGGVPGGGAGVVGQMPGMEGMPPEMQAMMQQMMASGMDPSQMDMNSMMQMYGGGGGGAGGGQGGQGGQGQGFGGGYGGQGQYGGYEQQMGGGRGGRGRGRRW